MMEIRTFIRNETHLLDDFERILRQKDPPLADTLRTLRDDIETLASIVSRSPSPTRDLLEKGGVRNLESLAGKLCDRGVDQVVDLPAKAVLGNGFTVSKLHLFGLLFKLTLTIADLEKYRPQTEQIHTEILFDLMAENLYSTILTNSTPNDIWAPRAARELIHLWDYRTSPNCGAFAPAIQELWRARYTIVPVLGTLLGTFELMRLSAQLPAVWLSFLSQPESPLMGMALEEFLFDLDFEDILWLRAYMADHGLSAVDRKTAFSILESQRAPKSSNTLGVAFSPEAESGGMQLYRSYLKRQKMARSRQLKALPGPYRTLEELFVTYLFTLRETS